MSNEVSGAVVVDHLTKSYGPTVALQDVSLSIHARVTGLLGPNGAGKSTLLKCLLGILTPDQGSIRIGDTDVVRSPFAARRLIGFMSEGDAVLPNVSALDYVTLAAELCGLPRAEAVARAHQVLQYVGLGEARYRDVTEYSTGMRQRARLAQALVANPRILLLDEPTSGLDPDGREEMLALIRDIPARTGCHVILSTHILPDVEKTCEDVIVIASGRVQYAGALAPLVAKKQDSYVVDVGGDPATFQRELELLGCVVTKEQGRFVVRLPEHDGGKSERILRAAHTTGSVLRHLQPYRLTLESAFLATVAQAHDAAHQMAVTEKCP